MRNCRSRDCRANLALVERLKAVGARHGNVTAGTVAVAWTLRHPAVTAAIVGFPQRRPGGRDCRAAEVALTEEEVREIERAAR